MLTRLAKIVLFTVLILSLTFTSSVAAMDYENHSQDNEQQWWFNKSPKRGDADLPPLKGGPERNERQGPISNIDLQEQFPDVVFLQGAPTDNRIAITFDDGPDPRFTSDVLDVLAEYNVPATFFLMGSRAIAYPEIVERMQNEGHIIGNHSYWHPNLVKEGDLATLENEVQRTEDTLANLVGYRTKLFRAPYGFLNTDLVEKLAELDYYYIAWSVDSLDWQEEPPQEIANRVVSNVEPGAIILMHDGGDWDADRTSTIESLRTILPTLQGQGYQFVTVPELLGIPYQK